MVLHLGELREVLARAEQPRITRIVYRCSWEKGGGSTFEHARLTTGYCVIVNTLFDSPYCTAIGRVIPIVKACKKSLTTFEFDHQVFQPLSLVSSLA